MAGVNWIAAHPPMRQLDMGLARQLRIGGQKQFEIRAEVFNLTNTPAFELPAAY